MFHFKIKKLLAALLAIALLLGAAPASFAGGSPAIAVSSGSAAAGEDVTLTVTLSNNPGVIGGRLAISYGDRLQLVSAEDGGLLKNPVFGDDTAADPYYVTWEDSLASSDNMKNGTLLTLHFHVRDDADSGEEAVSLSYVPGDFFDKDLNNVDFALSPGTVTVSAGHVHNYSATVTPPTCTEGGYTTYTCACGSTYVSDEVPPLGHDLTTHPARDPSCTESGWSEYATCSRCGYTDYEEIPALGHDFSDWAVAEAPSCTEAGVGSRACSRCGVTQTRPIDALGHDPVSHAAAAPTCTAAGWADYVSCSRCDYTTYEEIPALGHDFGEWAETVAASCTEDGEESRVCSRCGETETRSVPATGHDIVRVGAQAPTCTEPGWEEYDACTRCDWSTKEDVPPLGHDFGEWSETVAASCTEEGVESRTCQRCGSVETRRIPAAGHVEEPIPVVSPTCTAPGHGAGVRCSVCGQTLAEPEYVAPLGHDYEHFTTLPTCTAGGYTTHTCSRCGDTYIDGTTEPLGHLWDEGTVTVEPTEETDGLMTFVCLRCGDTGTQVIPSVVHEHDYSATVTEPTCTEQGYTTYVCLCGDSYVSDFTAPLGHDLTTHAASAPTCVTAGWDEYDTCSRCDYTTYEEIPALGHDLIRCEAQAPTCSEPGWDEYATCSRCDYTTFEEIPALGHDLVRNEAKAPTCSEPGWDEYDTCSRCDYTTYEEIPALGHDLVHYEAKEPTCTGVGWDEYESCSRCDYSTYEEIPALGHDPVRYDAQEPMCTEPGWAAYDACTRCDYTTYEEIPATGHDLISHGAKAPTCTEAGWNEFVSCTRCDYTTYAELSALGHDLTVYAAKDPTCTEAGWAEYAVCSWCDYSTYEEIPATGHDLTAHEAKAPTCVTAGWAEYETCSRCDYSTYEEIPAAGHDLTTHEAKAPTCVTAGWAEYETCSRCDYTTYEEIPATGHAITAHDAKKPTCTGAGWDRYESCSRCGYTTYKEIPPTGHDWSDWSVSKAATVSSAGEEISVCRNDASHVRTRVIPKLSLPFSDVAADAYYADAVAWAVSAGVTSGTSPTAFSPDAACTRAQVVTFLWRSLGSPQPKNAKNSFSDVKSSDYFFSAVLWAVENGITVGTSPSTFSPDATCTRGQVVTFLWRSNGSPSPKSSSHSFTDVKNTDYFLTPVLWAVENEITKGTSPTAFSPDGKCTRAQVVTFLKRSVDAAALLADTVSLPMSGPGTKGGKEGAREKIIAGLRAIETEIYLSEFDLTSDELKEVVQSVMNTVPEFFYVGSLYYMRKSGDRITSYLPTYTATSEEIVTMKAEYERRLGQIVSQIDPSWSDLEKALFAHDYIASNFRYDKTYTFRDVYSFFTEGRGVCQAYTLLYIAVLEQVGVEVDSVTNSGGSHTWNRVKVGGVWYHVDVTWDDPISTGMVWDEIGTAYHDFFLLSDAAIKTETNSHASFTGSYADFECTDTRYDDAEWNGAKSPFVPVDGSWYFIAPSGSWYGIFRADSPTASPTLVTTLSGKWYFADTTSYYAVGYFSGFFGYDGKLVYNTPSEVLSFDPASGETSLLMRLSDGEKYFLGVSPCARTDGTFYYESGVITHTSPYYYYDDPVEAPPVAMYDVDVDGYVSMRDAAVLRRFLAGQSILINRNAANADGVGSVTAGDYAALRAHLAGN